MLPVSTVLLAVFLPGETLVAMQALGVALAILSLAAATYKQACIAYRAGRA